MPSLHTVITKFPAQIQNLDDLEKMIKKTVQLQNKYPVDSLNELKEQYNIRMLAFFLFINIQSYYFL
jgi:hypothetical protein